MTSIFKNIFSGNNKRSTKSSSDRVIGVDIGTTSIKVVELQNRDNVITLTTYGEIQIGPYAEAELGKSVMLTARKEQEAVIDLLRESAVEATSAVYTVPLVSSFVTVMELPILEGEEDVSSQIQVEARKYIPVPINEVSLDWAEITRPGNKKGNERTQEVLLAAIQNETLERLDKLMKYTNMPNQPTEIECFSLVRGVVDPTEQHTAIIDLGGGSCKLYITREGLLEQIHRVRQGGAAATEKIAEALSCSFAEAELKKRMFDPKTEIGNAIMKEHRQTFARPLREFKKVLNNYEEKHGVEVKKVLLVGGSSLFNGMSTYVGDELNKNVTFGSPFDAITYPAFMEDMAEEIGPTFAVALGAALRFYE